MNKLFNVDAFRTQARKRLPKIVFDYLEGGAEEESGIANNRHAFARIRFRPRRLVDVSRRDTSATILGRRTSAPLVIGPTGLNGMLWPKADVALAKAAERFGIPFALSTASSQSIEEVARHSRGELWFQLYVVDRALAKTLASRALNAGYKTLVLTVDVGVNGKRERDLRNGFSLPFKYGFRTLLDGALHPRWSLQLLRSGAPLLANFKDDGARSGQMQAAVMGRRMDASFDWQDLEQLREQWPHQLLVKGILRPEDAARCAAAGVDGVIVSNHGGRQLDGAVAPIDVLGAVRHSTSKAVFIDSGIRRGADVVKAIALGADAVLLGRATLYGLAVDGERGVLSVLSLLKEEIDTTLAQIGCASLSELTPDFLSQPTAAPA